MRPSKLTNDSAFSCAGILTIIRIRANMVYRYAVFFPDYTATTGLVSTCTLLRGSFALVFCIRYALSLGKTRGMSVRLVLRSDDLLSIHVYAFAYPPK